MVLFGLGHRARKVEGELEQNRKKQRRARAVGIFERSAGNKSVNTSLARAHGGVDLKDHLILALFEVPTIGKEHFLRQVRFIYAIEGERERACRNNDGRELREISTFEELKPKTLNIGFKRK